MILNSPTFVHVNEDLGHGYCKGLQVGIWCVIMASASLGSIKVRVPGSAHTPAYDISRRRNSVLQILSQNSESSNRPVASATSSSSVAETLGGAQRLSDANLSSLLESAYESEPLEADQSLPQNAGLPLSG